MAHATIEFGLLAATTAASDFAMEVSKCFLQKRLHPGIRKSPCEL
jgi:hypothetical protein